MSIANMPDMKKTTRVIIGSAVVDTKIQKYAHMKAVKNKVVEVTVWD